MRQVAAIVMSCCLLAACNPAGNGGESGAQKSGNDRDLECAALISAADLMITRQKLNINPGYTKNQALNTGMTYLNSYAIPRKMKEKEAFEQLAALRETLTSSLSRDDIILGAQRCMGVDPA